MTDLTTWLLERIAEDEAAARAASVLTQWDPKKRDHVPIPSEPAIWVAGDGYGGGAVERTNGHQREPGIVVYDEGSPNESEAAHIARHDPAHVLAVCEAHRRIVELHELSPYYGLDQYGRWLPHEGEPKFWYCDCESGDGMISRDGPCGTLRALAGVYVDHPDYREEWRP